MVRYIGFTVLLCSHRVPCCSLVQQEGHEGHDILENVFFYPRWPPALVKFSDKIFLLTAFKTKMFSRASKGHYKVPRPVLHG